MGIVKPILGLLGLAAAYVGYEKGAAYVQSKRVWPLKAGEAYSVHLRYNGAGVGGPPTSAQVLAVLNANAPGALSLANAPTVDPTNKVITFLVVAPAAYSMPATVLTTGWAGAYGTVSVLSVMDVGADPLSTTA